MPEDQKCAVCKELFTQSNIAWIISQCGHNICNQCLKKAMSLNAKQIHCSYCNINHKVDKQTLEQFPKNITILKRLRQNKSVPPPPSQLSDSTMLMSNSSHSSVRSVAVICSKHAKPLDIICTIDRQLLCAHCAIFGGHQNHSFKTLQQFDNELNELRQFYNDSELKKQICDEGLRGKKYRSSIIAKISQKKDALVVQIKDKFQKLYNAIKDAESQLFDQLNKCFRSLQLEIGKATKEQQAVQRYFNEWKSKMRSFIQQIQNSSQLKQKVQIYYDSNKPHLLEGQKYLKQFEQSNQAIRASIIQKINSIQTQYSNNIEGSIYNYAKVAMSHIQLKAKQIDEINLIGQFDDMQYQARKTMKIQFVKSNQIEEISKFTPTMSTQMKSDEPSPLMRVRSNPKLPKTFIQKIDTPKKSQTPQKHKLKQIQNKNEQHFESANKMLNQFLKSTDTLDISGLELSDQQIAQVVASAANKKVIKCIKICKNKLTNHGLTRLLEYIPSVTNMNLSYNLLTDDVVDLLIDKRESLPCLRIINLSHNKINERRIKTKADELKRVGIITTF